MLVRIIGNNVEGFAHAYLVTNNGPRRFPYLRTLTEPTSPSFYLLPCNLFGSAYFSFIANLPQAQTRCAALHNTHCSLIPTMKLSYIQSLLFCFLPILTSAHPSPPSTEGSPRGGCIHDNEVEGIAQRWLNAFATGGLHTLDSAVTENVRQVFSS